MTDTLAAEMAMWDARCNDLQNSLDRVREERDELKQQNEQLVKDLNITIQASIDLNRELSTYKQMVERMRIAMAQGAEL
jgi:predicted  nucleic acid-binding Zn-ribbon protein